MLLAQPLMLVWATALDQGYMKPTIANMAPLTSLATAVLRALPQAAESSSSSSSNEAHAAVAASSSSNAAHAAVAASPQHPASRHIQVVKSTCSLDNIQHAALRGLENSATWIVACLCEDSDSSIPYVEQLIKRQPSVLADMIAALHMLLAWQLQLRYAQHDRHAAAAAAVAAASSSSSQQQQQQQQRSLSVQPDQVPAWHEQYLDALGGHVRDSYQHSIEVTGTGALGDTLAAVRLLLDVCANQLHRQELASSSSSSSTITGLVPYGRQQLSLSEPLLLLHLEAMLLEP
jgi:hypothetical protein